VDWLWGFVSNQAAQFSSWVSYLVQLLRLLFADLIVVATGLNFLAEAEQGVWARLRKFLTFGWLFGIGGTLAKLMSWIHQLQAWLKKHLAGIIAFIKKVRAWFDRYYAQHILPLINLIQRIRRYLLILRLLHIHWADKLDKYLLKEEQYLNKFFLTARGYLNQALNLASLATNPVSLARLVLVSVAGRRAMGALCNAVTGLQIGHFFPSTAKTAFAFEKQPMTARDYTDPATNQTPSEILSPLISDFAAGSYEGDYGPTDPDVDATEHLPWGQQYIDSLLAGNAAYDATLYDGLSVIQALEAKAGNLYNSGDGASSAAMAELKSA
jgi:hypothetical protein